MLNKLQSILVGRTTVVQRMQSMPDSHVVLPSDRDTIVILLWLATRNRWELIYFVDKCCNRRGDWIFRVLDDLLMLQRLQMNNRSWSVSGWQAAVSPLWYPWCWYHYHRGCLLLFWWMTFLRHLVELSNYLDPHKGVTKFCESIRRRQLLFHYRSSLSYSYGLERQLTSHIIFFCESIMRF